jgi:hypothetical protein
LYERCGRLTAKNGGFRPGQSMGNTTCGGFTGGWRHEEIDAQTYVDWGVRWFMHDTCWDFGWSDGDDQHASGIPQWAEYLELIVDGGRRARSHCRFAPALIRFTPD